MLRQSDQKTKIIKSFIITCLLFLGLVSIFSENGNAASIVPSELKQPGTQPGQVIDLDLSSNCDDCHGGYNQNVEPDYLWRGSMMANASRDPLFWAAMAVSEQVLDGSGDLCLRCHAPTGWVAGRSVPTDGSSLVTSDAQGVNCDACHRLTNPSNQEHLGVMTTPYIANNHGTPAIGYYGSAILSLWNLPGKHGPYANAENNTYHTSVKSLFVRDSDFCGSCHDVSNPAVGDLSPNNGAQAQLAPGTFSGVLGSDITSKAAFNNFPFMYGVLQRTFSEFKAGSLSTTQVSNYHDLPADLKTGAIQDAYLNSLSASTPLGNYQDGTVRYFSCQTCHLPAVIGKGHNKGNAITRDDLPLHDMMGGNYWAADAILYQNSQGTLRLGGSLSALQISSLSAAKLRAAQQLDMAASLNISGNTVRITNLTGHKLISGFPDGRRMWLNVQWYGAGDVLLREDGAFGMIDVTLDGSPLQVKSLLQLDDPYTKLYETQSAISQDWAEKMIDLGYPSDLALSYDRLTGQVITTLGDLAAQSNGVLHPTFHLILNNTIAKDTRIPPYGFSYDQAQLRNALPVPANQYGNPGTGGVYQYWDDFLANPPAGALSADIQLLFQPTSWEYIQFLYLANDRQNAFLTDVGVNLLTAWLNSGMAEPHVMATGAWTQDGNLAYADDEELCGGNSPCFASIADAIDHINDGGAVWIYPGVYGEAMNVDRDVTVNLMDGVSVSDFTQSTGNVNASNGVFTITGDFHRSGGVFKPNHGNVLLGGSTAQTISSPETFFNLIINNPTGVLLSDTITVNGDLTLLHGLVDVGNAQLLMGETAMVGGSPSATAMVIASGSGQMRKMFSGPTLEAFIFPVGTIGGLAQYSPVALEFTEVIGSGYVTVRVFNKPHPENLTLPRLKRYWTITQSGLTSFTCTATFTYVDEDLELGSGNESDIIGARWDGSKWIYFNLVNAASNTFQAMINSFSDFSGIARATWSLYLPVLVR